MAVSEALFGILHGVEVSVRNSLHHALSTDIGVEDWYQNGLPLPFPAVPQLTFTAPMRNMLDKARRNAGPAAPVGKLVAELTFGFWPFLISGQYHNLWSASSHKAFPHAHVPRSFVHTRLETIQRLRNRIAHHEPILSSTNEVYTGQLGHPKIALHALLECVSWVSPATADWLRVTSRYEQARATRTEWHRVFAWRNLSKFARTLQKGQLITFEGVLRYREVTEDVEGAKFKHRIAEIHATSMKRLSKIEAADDPADGAGDE